MEEEQDGAAKRSTRCFGDDLRELCAHGGACPFWAFFYNLVMIPLAVLGLMHPALAEVAMATSSVTVVSNANLLRRVDIRARE